MIFDPSNVLCSVVLFSILHLILLVEHVSCLLAHCSIVDQGRPLRDLCRQQHITLTSKVFLPKHGNHMGF